MLGWGGVCSFLTCAFRDDEMKKIWRGWGEGGGCVWMFPYFYWAFREAETFLNNSSQLPNTSSLLSQHTLGSGCKDDDLSTSWGNTNLYTTVAILCKLSCKKLIQLSLKDSISDKLNKGTNWSQFISYRNCRPRPTTRSLGSSPIHHCWLLDMSFKRITIWI